MQKDKRETDALVQVWLERRYLATVQRIIAKFEPTPAQHLSELVRYAIEVFVESAVDQGLITFVDTTSEATNMLSRFKTNLNPSKKGLRNLVFNLQRDSVEDTLQSPIPHDSFSQAQIDEIMKTELAKLEDEQGGPDPITDPEDME